MINGKYTISIDGVIVHEESNLITSYGRLAILRYLAGITNTYAGAIAVGVSDTSPTVNDSSLGYEVYQAPIVLKTVNYNDSQILFKASFPAGDQYSVYEIGLYPEDSVNRGSLLHYFDSLESWEGATEDNLVDGRIGESGITMRANSGGTVSISNDSWLSLTTLQANDKLELAAVLYDDNCEYIRITFTDINGDTMYADFVPSAFVSSPQYDIITVERSVFTGQDKEWGNIVRMDVDVKANSATNTVVVLDGFRTTDSNILTGSEIVSKTRLSSPVVKSSLVTLDIQYSMSVPI